MSSLSAYINGLRSGRLDAVLTELYGEEGLSVQRQRYGMLLSRMEQWVGDSAAVLVTAPGRTELGGNHTDHNSGVVLAAAVSFDCVGIGSPREDAFIRIKSEGFAEVIQLNLETLDPQEDEIGSSAALIRGVADSLKRSGFAIGGFDACISGEVPVGSGLSSSAAFEVCIGQLFNQLFNDGSIPPVELARAGRRAENLHFGKPCGFMDQIACAVQGVLSIDFKDQDNPAIKQVVMDLESSGYQLCVVDTGGDHADLTPEYAAIPDEMTAAAKVLGQETARGLTIKQVLASAADIRAKAGDRALLRLIHFIEENERAIDQARVLESGELFHYFKLVAASGDSSWRLLQNCSSITHPGEQPITVALTLTELLLGQKGAWRVQGGGFAGTIQAYVPEERFEEYKAYMESIFGPYTVVPLRIRKPGYELIMPELDKDNR